MAYLRTAAEVAAIIGVQCNGQSPVANDPKFIAMLDDAHARIEESLNIPSLALSGYSEKFNLESRFPHKTETFRLHAGFVKADSVVVTDPLGEAVNSDRLTIDAELGTVMIDDPIYGRYVIEYNAGFDVEDNDASLYAGTPSWLRRLVEQYAIQWFRTMVKVVTAPEGVSFSQMMAPLYKMISSSIYSRYQRPRVRVVFAYAAVPCEVFA